MTTLTGSMIACATWLAGELGTAVRWTDPGAEAGALEAEVMAEAIEVVATMVAKDGVLEPATSVGVGGGVGVGGEDGAEGAGDAVLPDSEAVLAAWDGDDDAVTPGWIGAGWIEGGWIGVWTIGLVGVGIDCAEGDVRGGFADKAGRVATAGDDSCETSSVGFVAVGLESSGSVRPPGRAEIGLDADCATTRASVAMSAEPAIGELAG
ncbi:MAG: hypothetical protein ACRYG8_50860 [Janthinobacterium lividum]